VARGPRMKPLDFGGNPDHVSLGLGLGGHRHAPHGKIGVTWHV